MRDVEELVALFLERREREPDLDPEAFCAEHAERAEELRAAIRSTLDAVAMFEPLPRPAQPAGGTGGPRRIGDYDLLREIGRGGMGVVFEARHRQRPDEGSVAVKILPLAGLTGERALQRFEREVRILQRMDHEQIVTAREFGTEDDTPFLVMDLVQGTPLGELSGELSPTDAAALVASLARAVQAAHDQGILHRDLKPANVIVRADGTPVLLDFGLVAARDEATITSTGDLLGTPRYMAPEQARGQPATVQSDVHALGLLLYELLTGRPAFRQEERRAALRAVARSRYPHPSRWRSDLPRELVRILTVAMAWNPRRRYASARELAEDLERLGAGEPVRARTPNPAQRAADLLRRQPTGSALTALGLALALSLVLGGLLPHLRARATERRTRVEALFDRAVARWIGGRSGQAEALLANALELDPEHPGARALMTRVGGLAPEGPQSRDVQLVLEGLDLEAGKLFPAARARYEAAHGSNPRSPWATVLLARSARASGDLQGAEVDLIEASQVLPDSLAVAQELARLLFQRGKHDQREKYDHAEREYRRALRLDAEDPWLWQGLAMCLFHLQRDEDALDATRSAMELSGELDPSLANTTAALLDRTGRHDEAQEILGRLVDEHPESVVYRFNLAFSLDSQSRVAEARPLYEDVLAREPGHVQATVCLAWLLATAEPPELRDEAAGEEHLLRALQLDRGRTAVLVRGAEEFARRSGRIDRIAELMQELAAEGEVDERIVRLERARRAMLGERDRDEDGNGDPDGDR